MDIIELIIDESKKYSSIEAVIMLGSYGDKAYIPQIGSDFDMYFLVSEEEKEPEKIVDQIIETLFADRLLLKVLKSNKTICYLNEPFVKLDLLYGHTLEENSRYLRGSEICHVLFTRTEAVQTELDKIMETKAVDCLPEYGFKYHQDRFVEMFELLCKSIARKDGYRVEFYCFLLRNSLVCMDLIKNAGVTQHLYLPKLAFQKCEAEKKLPSMLNLEMNGLKNVMKEYADYFLSLVDRLCNNIEFDNYVNFFDAILKMYF